MSLHSAFLANKLVHLMIVFLTMWVPCLMVEKETNKRIQNVGKSG